MPKPATDAEMLGPSEDILAIRNQIVALGYGSKELTQSTVDWLGHEYKRIMATACGSQTVSLNDGEGQL